MYGGYNPVVNPMVNPMAYSTMVPPMARSYLTKWGKDFEK